MKHKKSPEEQLEEDIRTRAMVLGWDIEAAWGYYIQEKKGEIAGSNWGDLEMYALELLEAEQALAEHKAKYAEYLI